MHQSEQTSRKLIVQGQLQMVALFVKVLKAKRFLKMTFVCTLSLTMGNRVVVFISCNLYRGLNLLLWLGIIFTKLM